MPDGSLLQPGPRERRSRSVSFSMWIPRVGRLFNEQALPLSIALNAAFPEEHPDVWQHFRSLVPKAPIIAHGINNSTELLPLGRAVNASPGLFVECNRATAHAMWRTSASHACAEARLCGPVR